MSRSIFSPPPCDCCGAEYKNTGCVRGYRCSCRGLESSYCDLCKFCSQHCQCNDEMKEKLAIARLNYLEALRLVRIKHPKQVNKRLVHL